MKKKLTERSKVKPTGYDLAIIKVVETLTENLKLLNDKVHESDSRQDILDAIGVTPSVWGEMRNHYRHVTTKSDRKAQIITQLKHFYRVNPEYIQRYPHEDKMFLDEIFSNEADIEYHTTAGELKRICQAQKELIERLQEEITRKDEEIATLKDMTFTQNDLIKMLRAQIPDTKAKKA